MATQVATLAATPFFLQAGADDPLIYYTAADFRRLIGAIWNRPGIVTGNAYYVSQGDTVGWRVKVGGGFCVFGNYLVYNPSAITVELSTFDTTPSSTRTHRVYVAVYDKLVSGNEYAGKVVVTEDVGSGAPAPPNATAYLLIATVTISPNQTSIRTEHIKDRRTHASNGTGYTVLDLAANMVDAKAETGTATVRCDYVNGTIRLSGSIRRTGNFTAGGTHLLTTLPSAFWPGNVKYLAASATASSNALPSVQIKVLVTGEIYAIIPETFTPHTIYLDGLTFEVD